MATTRASITDKAGRTIEMKSTPDFTNDAAFDSFIVVHENGKDNHTLTLVLKLYLHKVVPATATLPVVGTVKLPYKDWNKTPFVIKSWSATDFAVFKKEFLKQCAHWNNKFWLTPPASFSKFDYKLGGRTVRPNFYCHLHVEVVDSAAAAHRTFKVVNLDKPAAALQLGKSVADLNATDFRSDSATYDSLDIKPVPLPFVDDKGTLHTMNRSTIAHEIGHALGQPHSGVPHAAPIRALAVLADGLLSKTITGSASFPAVLKGGSNSNACYGSQGPANVGSNVMGYGLDFDATNATTWLNRIALHTGTKVADWKVSVKTKVAPKYI